MTEAEAEHGPVRPPLNQATIFPDTLSRVRDDDPSPRASQRMTRPLEPAPDFSPGNETLLRRPCKPSAERKAADAQQRYWSWEPDDDTADSYNLYEDGDFVAYTTLRQFTLDELECGLSYVLGVEAVGANGRRSPRASVTAASAPCTALNFSPDPAILAATPGAHNDSPDCEDHSPSYRWRFTGPVLYESRDIVERSARAADRARPRLVSRRRSGGSPVGTSTIVTPSEARASPRTSSVPREPSSSA